MMDGGFHSLLTNTRLALCLHPLISEEAGFPQQGPFEVHKASAAINQTLVALVESRNSAAGNIFPTLLRKSSLEFNEMKSLHGEHE